MRLIIYVLDSTFIVISLELHLFLRGIRDLRLHGLAYQCLKAVRFYGRIALFYDVIGVRAFVAW